MKGVVLITGGSSGIGAAIAELAVADGYPVCINFKSRQRVAEALAERLRQQGGQVKTVQADIATEAGVAMLFQALDAFGSLHALVNNAGIITRIHPFEETHLSQLSEVFSTNVFGSFLCAREAVKRLSTKYGGRGGCIVNVSSIAARLGSPNEFIDYAATKGAIDTFTLGLAKEVAPYGVRVNAVRPGLIDTDMHAHAGDPLRAEKLKQSIPMQRVGTAQEVAELVMWLIGAKSGYVCGALLDVSGGR